MILNQYIVENAGREIDNSFWIQFSDTEVFFAIVEPNQPLQTGLLNASNLTLRLLTVKLDVGCMALFYTTKTDSRLSQQFGGMPLIKAMEMVCDLDSVDGMLIQSDSEAWFAADKKVLNEALSSIQEEADRHSPWSVDHGL